MMSIYIPSKMELNWDFNMTNATLKWFCPNCGCTATLAGMQQSEIFAGITQDDMMTF